MKKQFTIPVTVTAYTKEEAESQVNLLLQMGAFLKDLNVQNLAGSFVQHFLLAKLNQFTQGKVDLSSCYNPSGTPPSVPLQKPVKKATSAEQQPKNKSTLPLIINKL